MAGIHDIGACSDDLGEWSPHELRRLISGHHVRVSELEWVDLGEPDPHAEDNLFRMADIFGARQLNVGVCSADIYPDIYLARRLRSVAQRAGSHGLVVAFEPVVFGSVTGVSHVQRLIEMADVSNVGTLLDVYHMARSCWDSLRDVRADMVAGVQINGIDRPVTIPSWPDGLLREAQCDRLMPDEGDFPVATWLQRLRDLGVRARLSVEVLSDAHRALPLFDAAQRVASTSEKFAEIWEAPR